MMSKKTIRKNMIMHFTVTAKEKHDGFQIQFFINNQTLSNQAKFHMGVFFFFCNIELN